jgi:hypothetical protein
LAGKSCILIRGGKETTTPQDQEKKKKKREIKWTLLNPAKPDRAASFFLLMTWPWLFENLPDLEPIPCLTQDPHQ